MIPSRGLTPPQPGTPSRVTRATPAARPPTTRRPRNTILFINASPEPYWVPGSWFWGSGFGSGFWVSGSEVLGSGTSNPEPGTRNPEPGTQNGTQNSEPRTQNPEPSRDHGTLPFQR